MINDIKTESTESQRNLPNNGFGSVTTEEIKFHKRGQKQTFARVLLYVWSASFLSPVDKQKNKIIQFYIPNNNHNYNKKRVIQIKQLACNTQSILEYSLNQKVNIDTQTSRYEKFEEKKKTTKSKEIKKQMIKNKNK